MMSDDELALAAFQGVARLFPLPNMVFFPHVDQGLHIFEPCYIKMTVDALAGDHLLALVLLQNESKRPSNLEGLPAIEEMACLGRIVAFEELADGRFNLRLRGLQRMRIASELPADELPFRRVNGLVIGDELPADVDELIELRRQLRQTVLKRFDSTGTAYRQIDDLFDTDAPLGRVCDLLSYALPLPTELKQQLLAEPQVTIRAEILMYALHQTPRPDRKFPPDFSAN